MVLIRTPRSTDSPAGTSGSARTDPGRRRRAGPPPRRARARRGRRRRHPRPARPSPAPAGGASPPGSPSTVRRGRARPAFDALVAHGGARRPRPGRLAAGHRLERARRPGRSTGTGWTPWPDREPVRVQHRSGAMWVLNSAALRAGRSRRAPGWTGVRARRPAACPPAGCCGWTNGCATGCRPARAPAGCAPSSAAYALECARAGVTGFTDATPGSDQADVDEFGAAVRRPGILPQRLVLMAPPGLRRAGGRPRSTLGPQQGDPGRRRPCPTARELGAR